MKFTTGNVNTGKGYGYGRYTFSIPIEGKFTEFKNDPNNRSVYSVISRLYKIISDKHKDIF